MFFACIAVTLFMLTAGMRYLFILMNKEPHALIAVVQRGLQQGSDTSQLRLQLMPSLDHLLNLHDMTLHLQAPRTMVELFSLGGQPPRLPLRLAMLSAPVLNCQAAR